jgi:hypothetical protein
VTAHADPVLLGDGVALGTLFVIEAVAKAHHVLDKFCEIVANDNPYAWLFSPKYIFYAHTSKVKKAQPTLAYGIGRDTWWVE